MLDDRGPEADLAPETPDPAEAPAEVRYAFWVLVAVFNLALLALSVGVMLVGFEGRYVDGGALIAGGLLLGALGYYRYRRVVAGF